MDLNGLEWKCIYGRLQSVSVPDIPKLSDWYRDMEEGGGGGK